MAQNRSQCRALASAMLNLQGLWVSWLCIM